MCVLIGSYDIRIICEENETPERIADKIIAAINTYKPGDTYVSTRQVSKQKPPRKTFSDVILEGLAPDGGLYVPQRDIPRLSPGQWKRLVNLSYPERALRILEQWLDPRQLHPSKLSDMVSLAYNCDNFDCMKVFPVVHIYENVYANELFYGPTASFKDAALQLLPHFFKHSLKHSESGNK